MFAGDYMKKRLYDSKEACKIFGVSLQTLRTAIRIGKIKTVYIGRFLRIPSEEIERLIGHDNELLTVKEAAAILSISQEAIRTLARAEKIKAFRLAADFGPFKVLKSDIERIAKEGTR